MDAKTNSHMHIYLRGYSYFEGVEFMCPYINNVYSMDDVNPSMLEGL